MDLGEYFHEDHRRVEDEMEFDESECTDDSDDDPSFDIVEETRLAIDKLSIKKPRVRRCKIVDDNLESEPEKEAVENEIHDLDKKDEKSFEKVEQLIEAGGHLEKLTLHQCKIYLRKYGLRLTGNKGILISRIREHKEIIDGCGEKKYPPKSFVFNCKGDACLGDVVIFEQNVYDMFSIVSRSATGPPCGTRIVAGRIVKESYGVAKQQHTFTIEVLWSKGEKPLSPLHQLLIKGRNLYRIKTMRQRWVDEGERLKVLQEKHGRGSRARYSREMRIKEKEKRTKGIMIRRKNLTGDHISATTENQHLQQKKMLKNKVNKHELVVRSNGASFAGTQQMSDGVILQPPPQSILGKPRTAEHVLSVQASTRLSPKPQNFHYVKRRLESDRNSGKHLTDDRIPAYKENQQINSLNHTEHNHEQEVKSSITSLATTQQIRCSIPILQQTSQSILGKPETTVHAIFSAQNFWHTKHGFHKHHIQTKRHGFQEKPYYFHGNHLQPENYFHHMNQTASLNHPPIYPPLQQQHPEYQRQPLQPYMFHFSQGQ